MTGQRQIVVATSFPPQLVRSNVGRPFEDYDRLCLRSWLECGFRVLAVNDADEIPPLKARYPHVEFVAAPRNAKPVWGRGTPYIADILALLAQQPEPVLGIINSDLLFEPVLAWQQLRGLVPKKTLVTGQRYDVRSLAGGALHVYVPGFDYFFFDHAAAEWLAKETRPFAMGQPWWDYWFPLSLALAGYEIMCLRRPAVLHLVHGQQTEARTPAWRELAQCYAQSLIESEWAEAPPAGWADLLALSREFAKATDGELTSGARDQDVIHLSELTVPLIATNLTNIDDPRITTVHTAVPAIIFENLERRVQAGRALYEGLWEEDHKCFEVAMQRYLIAAEHAPLDAGVLQTFGDFLFRIGSFEEATVVLRRAADLAPHLASIHATLGTALGSMGRNIEAISSFERALEIDPRNWSCYYNLAITLYPLRRHEQAIARLQAQLAQESDRTAGEEWLNKIHERVAQFDREIRARPGGQRF